MYRVNRVFGLRRSGNHLFINWLMQQSPENVEFFNNVDLNCPEARTPDKAVGVSAKEGVKIYSFEDRNLDLAADRKWLDAVVGKDDLTLDFVVLRDPANLFASRVKSGKIKPYYVSGMSVPELAYQYFDYCESKEWWKWRFGGVLIPVFYDKFIESENYRQSIAGQAGLKRATYFSLNLVDTRYGNGSSFNPGQTVSADVNALKSRWRDLDKGRGIWDEWMSRYVEIARLGTNPFWIEQKDSEPYKCIHGNHRVKVYLKNLWKNIWVACLLNLRMADSISRLRSWFGLRKSIY